ncbi:unnamed protein product [Calicophoron daubneyi]|uniref:MRG domain-containing protein n=1 Tax=Calicophoron daubneyi TaxID=300641 RepID=A0AAV2T8L1_CALDB
MRPLVYRYDVGQRLLCFEPDTSKAKVIYFAKILKHVQKAHSEVPHYAVHFDGWKCKWDREVPEHLLLDDTEFNRTLKKKIDEIARNVRCRHKRKQRIDMVLEMASIAKDGTDWDSIPGIWSGKQTHHQKSLDQEHGALSVSDRASDKCESVVSDDVDTESLDSEEATQLEYENLQIHQAFAAPLQLPVVLQSVINTNSAKTGSVSNFALARRGWCSVLQLLQSYVDGFPYQGLKIPSSFVHENCKGVACPERALRFLGPAYAKVDQSRLICADVCSSLRVLFDATLRSHLLLSEERRSVSNWSQYFLHKGYAFRGAAFPSSEFQPVYRYSSPRYELLPDLEAEKTPDIPCVKYPAHFLLRLFVNLPVLLSAMHMTACRRSIIIRQVHMFLKYLDKTADFWFSPTVPKSVDVDKLISGRREQSSLMIEAKRELRSSATQSSSSSGTTEPQTDVAASARRTRQSDRNRLPSVVLPKPEASESDKHPTAVMSKREPEITETSSYTAKLRSSWHHPSKLDTVPESALVESHYKDESDANLSHPPVKRTRRVSGAQQAEQPLKDISLTEGQPEQMDAKRSARHSRLTVQTTASTNSSGPVLRSRTSQPISFQMFVHPDVTLTRLRHPILTSLRLVATAASSKAPPSSDITPPLKRYRDCTSVLRALASCVRPVPEAPDFRLGGDPWLGSKVNLKMFLLAKARGRMAAKFAIRDFFPNDIAAFAKEVPRVDRWLPLQTPDSILERFSEGALPPSEAMDRLILLLAPKHAWKLYSELAPSEKWSDEMLYRLLDLLCATNSGMGGAYSHSLLDVYDLSSLPDPEELHFADELIRLKDSKLKNSKLSVSTKPVPIPSEGSAEVEDTESAVQVVETEEGEQDLTAALHSGSWNLHGPAEQLFDKEKLKLGTPAGFCSIIRGAAKFGNPHRALELADMAWALPEGVRCLNQGAYDALLRSLHLLPSVRKGEEDVWTHLRAVLERYIASGLPVTVSTFCSALHCLAEAATESAKNENKQSYANLAHYCSVGLGLLSEMRQLYLEPTLGAMASVLKLARFTCISSIGTEPSSVSYQTYGNSACFELTKSFILELENRFRLSPPSHTDNWTLDDFAFFPLAMRVALHEHSLALAEQIDNLLVEGGDKRFLLGNSFQRREYAHAHCVLVLNPSQRDTPLQSVCRAEALYRQYRSEILTGTDLVARFTSFLIKYLGSTMEEARNTAYSCLCSVLIDLISEVRYFKSLPSLIKVLSRNSAIDPFLASSVSSATLRHIKQTEEKVPPGSQRPMSNARVSREARATINSAVVQDLVRMVFPAAIDAVKNLENLDLAPPSQSRLKDAILTIQAWSDYAVERNAVLWGWGAEAVAYLWHFNDRSMDNTIADVLTQLSTTQYTPADLSEAKKTEAFLAPILDSWELQSPGIDDFSEYAQTVNRQHDLAVKMRRILIEAVEKASSEPAYSNNVLRILSETVGDENTRIGENSKRERSAAL